MSNSESSSYQNEDPRKYEFPPTSPTRFEIEGELDNTLDLISETCSLHSTRLIDIIQQLRSEKKDLEHTVMQLNTKEMEP